MTQDDHHRVSSLVTDLVEMANATKRLPEIEAELSAARDIILKDGATISRLELKLIDRSNEIDELKAKLRAAEVERDDAGFRQLEAEDKVAHLADVHKNIRASVDDILRAVGLEEIKEAVKPVEIGLPAQNGKATEDSELPPLAAQGQSEVPPTPVPEPQTGTGMESEALSFEGQSVKDPTVGTRINTLTSSTSGTVSEAAQASDATITADASGGSQSDLPPTPDVASSPVGNSFGSASIGGVVSQATVQPLASARYAGKLYRSWPVYVSEAAWIDGGGTSESYWEGREQYRSAV